MTKPGLLIFSTIGAVLIFVIALWSFKIRPGTQVTEHSADTEQTERESNQTLQAHTSKKSGTPDSPQTMSDLMDVLDSTRIPSKADVDAFLRENGRTESNLLAAMILNPDESYLKEALRLFPESPEILVAALSRNPLPDNASELAETLTFLEPDNALNHYLHGKVLLESGEIDTALVTLKNGASASSFHSAFKEQVEGLTAFHEFQGSDPDIALLQSVYGVPMPHLESMRNLTRVLAAINGHDEITVGVGVAMGNHLSQGEGNNLLINQLVGLSIEKEFLESQPPDTYNPYLNQTHENLLRDIEGQRDHIKKLINQFNTRLDQMSIDEAAAFTRIIVEEGEEDAIRKTFR